MGPVKKEWHDGGHCVLTAESGGREFRVKAQREVKGPIPREASVSWGGLGPVSARQADDFAALIKAAASLARS